MKIVVLLAAGLALGGCANHAAPGQSAQQVTEADKPPMKAQDAASPALQARVAQAIQENQADAKRAEDGLRRMAADARARDERKKAGEAEFVRNYNACIRTNAERLAMTSPMGEDWIAQETFRSCRVFEVIADRELSDSGGMPGAVLQKIHEQLYPWVIGLIHTEWINELRRKSVPAAPRMPKPPSPLVI